MERALGTAWVQAVPSVWEEPFGLVAAEAMMRGTATVTSRIGGLTEFGVEGDTGYSVPAGDATALAEALRRIVTDRRLAEAARRRCPSLRPGGAHGAALRGALRRRSTGTS